VESPVESPVGSLVHERAGVVQAGVLVPAGVPVQAGVLVQAGARVRAVEQVQVGQ